MVDEGAGGGQLYVTTELRVCIMHFEDKMYSLSFGSLKTYKVLEIQFLSHATYMHTKTTDS